MHQTKPIIKLLASIALLALLAACQNLTSDQNKDKSIFRQSAFLMGTLVEIKVVTNNSETAREVISAALLRMQAIEEEMSHYKSGSVLFKINQQAGKQHVNISPAFFDLLARGKHWGEISQGTFDITIGAISSLWNFENQKLPDNHSIKAALPLVDYKLLKLNQKERSAFLPKEGMALNLGGIAKGYAVDEALQVIKDRGIKHALVDAGGDMRALGGKSAGKPWKIGLQHPRQHKQIITSIPLSDKAIVTSGDYERFFMRGGKRYHHILNPDTGQPATGLIGVTVIAPTAETADVLSTAVFVLGAEKGLELITQQPECEALLITSSGDIITTGGFPADLKVKKLDLKGS